MKAYILVKIRTGGIHEVVRNLQRIHDIWPLRRGCSYRGRGLKESRKDIGF
jgi:hypothetical protein